MGLGMLLLLLVVLDPDPCLDRERSLKAEVLVCDGIFNPGDGQVLVLFNAVGGFLSPTSISTKTVLVKDGSSLVNVPCLTNLDELEPEELMELHPGEAKGARPTVLALGMPIFGGGELNLVLLACLSWVDLVPLGDPGGILGLDNDGALTMFLGLGAI